MPPKSKRRKLNPPVESVIQLPVHDPPRGEPVIFKSPGLVPDVRLRLFDTEYHVHSIILKLHSNYFRRFLDSPDKPERPQGARFRYEYITVIDEDGTWALESSETGCQSKLWVGPCFPKILIYMIAPKCIPINVHNDVDNYQIIRAASNTFIVKFWLINTQPEQPIGDKTIRRRFLKSFDEQDCFRYLLCAMYNRPYRIRAFREITTLARIADFYCALPIVSATLTPALMKSYIFESGRCYIEEDFGKLINVAKKLRNPEFFRECFTHLVGTHDIFSEIEDPAIQKLVLREYSELLRKIIRAQQKLIMPVSNGQITVTPEMAAELWSDADATRSAHFFRTLKRQVDGFTARLEAIPGARDVYIADLKEALQDLLSNNLQLDRCAFGLRENSDDDYFLCADLKDNEMPWDPEEIDW